MINRRVVRTDSRPPVLHPGRVAVIAYFAISYITPMIGNALFRDRLITTFEQRPTTVTSVLMVVVVFGVFWWLSNSVFVTSNRPPKSVWAATLFARMLRAYEAKRIWLAVIALGLAALYFALGLNTYRYGDVSISESDASYVVVLMNLVNALVSIDLFRVLLFVPQLRLQRRIETLLLAGAYLLSASSAFAVFLGLFAIVSALFPRFCYETIFSDPQSSKIGQFARLGGRVALLLGVFWLAWLVGEGIKRSSGSQGAESVLIAARARATDVVSEDSWIEDYFYYLIARASVPYYSLQRTADDLSDVRSVTGGVTPIVLPIQSFAFRADYLLGRPLSIARPEVGSMMRLNYLMVSADPTRFLRAGSSPGVIAAFNYALPMPLGLLLCGAYLAWMSRVIETMTWRRGRRTITLTGVIVLYIFTEVFLASPFDLLNIIDSSGIFVAVTYFMYRTDRVERWRQHQLVQPNSPQHQSPRQRALAMPAAATRTQRFSHSRRAPGVSGAV